MEFTEDVMKPDKLVTNDFFVGQMKETYEALLKNRLDRRAAAQAKSDGSLSWCRDWRDNFKSNGLNDARAVVKEVQKVMLKQSDMPRATRDSLKAIFYLTLEDFNKLMEKTAKKDELSD